MFPLHTAKQCPYPFDKIHYTRVYFPLVSSARARRVSIPGGGSSHSTLSSADSGLATHTSPATSRHTSPKYFIQTSQFISSIFYKTFIFDGTLL